MEILEAFDLTGSLRGAAELAGCDHKTVAHWVRARDAAGGGLPVAVGRGRWLTGSRRRSTSGCGARAAKVRADNAHRSWSRWAIWARSARRVGRSRRPSGAGAQEHGRRYRPWVPEPGLWMQWDYGDGPEVGGRATVLFCAWLAWSRFRVVLPLWDKTMPSVVMALDRALRAFGARRLTR